MSGVRSLDDLAAQLLPYDETAPADRMRELAETSACPVCGVFGKRVARTFVYRDVDVRTFLVCLNDCGHAEEI